MGKIQHKESFNLFNLREIKQLYKKTQNKGYECTIKELFN
jgi:hypothetical protein